MAETLPLRYHFVKHSGKRRSLGYFSWTDYYKSTLESLLRPSRVEFDLLGEQVTHQRAHVHRILVHHVDKPWLVTYELANSIMQQGGHVEAILTRPLFTPERFSQELRTLGQTLMTIDGALETLLLLAEEKCMQVSELVDNVVPEEKLLELISALSRCDLITITKRELSLSQKGAKLADRLKSHIQSGERADVAFQS